MNTHLPQLELAGYADVRIRRETRIEAGDERRWVHLAARIASQVGHLVEDRKTEVSCESTQQNSVIRVRKDLKMRATRDTYKHCYLISDMRV